MALFFWLQVGTELFAFRFPIVDACIERKKPLNGNLIVHMSLLQVLLFNKTCQSETQKNKQLEEAAGSLKPQKPKRGHSPGLRQSM